MKETAISENSCAIVSDEKSFKVRRNEYSNSLVPIELKSTSLKVPYEVMAIKNSLLILENYFPAKHLIYLELQQNQINSTEEVRKLRENLIESPNRVSEILLRYPISRMELYSVEPLAVLKLGV